MAKVGEYLLQPEDGWKRYDDSDSNIEYSSEWLPYHTGKMVQAKNQYIRFNFTGTKLRIIGDDTPAYELPFKIIVDSITYYAVDTCSADEHHGSLLIGDIANLSNGTHWVSIEPQFPVDVNSRYFFFNAIDIDENGKLEPYNPNPVPAISVPTNLTTTAGDAKVTLSWTAVTGATGYNVKRSTTAGGPYTTVGANVPGTTYVDSTVNNGTTYYYVVTAITADGESSNSNEASATPKAGSVTPPTPAGNTLLRVTMIDSSEREYHLTMSDVDNFVSWLNHHVSTDTLSYTLSKIDSKEYLLFDKIISFEVMPLTK